MVSLLAKVGHTQGDLYRGTGIARSVANRIVHGDWPVRRAQQYRDAIVQWFEQRGATEADIAALQATVEKQVAPASSHLAEASPAAQATTHAQQEDPMLLRNERLSAEAKTHFGLHRSPFVDDIQTRDDVFQYPGARVARAALMDAAVNHGFIALIGESGAGKSTLREELEQRILDESRPIIVIKPYTLEMEANETKGTPMKSVQIAESIIATLAPSTTMKCSPQARAKQAHELLCASVASGYSHLLVIEEAHRLPKATLKHLKGFLELKRGLQRVLGVALIGQTELRVLLSEQNPEVREVVQRCEVVEMRPLDNDLGDYLKHKFARMGLRLEDVFADDAVDAIRARLVRTPRGGKASDTVSICHPLVVNNLVCRAMNAAASVGYPRVDAQVIAGC
ncbi:MAG: AAA family ATPase [Proteobacteria bacterium]|nr:AAA family ATPase [Pseudomonadota bacterium]